MPPRIEHYPKPLISQNRPLIFLSLLTNSDESESLQYDLFHHLVATSLVSVRVCGAPERNDADLDAPQHDGNDPSKGDASHRERDSTAQQEVHQQESSAPHSSTSHNAAFLARFPHSHQHLYIPQAPTSKSYLNYKPKGILPRQWFRKVTEDIPGVVVLGGVVRFKSDVDRIRERAREVKDSGRNIRIVLVIQKLDVHTEEHDSSIASSSTIHTADDSSSSSSTTTTTTTTTTTAQQDSTSSPTTHPLSTEPTLDDKIKELRNEAEPRYIFMLNPLATGSDRLNSLSISRSVYDAAVLFYKDAIEKLKKFKKQISLSTQAYIHVRHRFKMGFYEEIIANRSKSFKYYSEAYHSLMNVTQYSEREIKILADYINLKLCQLKVREKKVDAAVKQFLRHIAWFNSKRSEGIKKIYEHYFLLYRQYRMFGDLLESPSSGYDLRKQKDIFGVNRNRNPAFYFQAAAEAAKERRYHVERLCSQYEPLVKELYKVSGKAEDKLKISTDTTDEDVEQEVSGVEIKKNSSTLPYDLQLDEEIYSTEGFVGQEVTYLSAEEQRMLEESGIPNLRQIARELIFDHFDTIHRIWSRVYSISLRYGDRNVNRLVFSIVYNMATEFERNQEWTRAFNFFKRVATFYKDEMWYGLLTDTVQHALTCARYESTPHDWIPLMLHLLSTELSASPEQQRSLWQEFTDYFSDDESKSNLPRFTSPLVVDYTSKDVLLDVKAHFNRRHVELHSKTTLSIAISSTSAYPLQASKLQVLFSDEKYNLVLQHGEKLSNGHEVDLMLEPGKNRNILKVPLVFKEKQDIVIFSVVLHFGHNPHVLCLRWNYQKDHTRFMRQIKHEGPNDGDVENAADFVHRPVIRVIAPHPKLSLGFQHVPPAMQNEHYCLRVLVHANGDNITKGVLELSELKDVLVYNDKLEEVKEVEFGEIGENETRELIVYVRFVHVQTSILKFVVHYETGIYSNYATEAEFALSSVQPFNLKHKMHPTRPSSSGTFSLTVADKDPQDLPTQSSSDPKKFATAYRTGDPIVVDTVFSCATSYPVIIKRVQFMPTAQIDSTHFQCVSPSVMSFGAHSVHAGDQDYSSEPLVLAQKDEFAVTHILQADTLPTSEGVQEVCAGMLEILCQRHSGLKNASSTIAPREVNYAVFMPNIPLFNPAVSVDVDIPPEAVVNEVFNVKISLHNNSSSIQVVDLQLEDSPHYIFSGISQMQRELPPFETMDLNYTLSANITGFVTLPRFSMFSGRGHVSFFNSREEWRIFIRDV
uniref:Trafficking protein particle complex subunit 11 domain-containing protein n=1 Tax=Percolomonas cosmopolitus TaxID=63605 RepID=A0A6U0JL80_9EUKA|eukprot:CAMPEP_0117444914 /NCGR_PEP_ID=MMETSP0759-20121206/5510_1 /TAXON_ID=63605 /ORGANISM="Percolomonas cosmopolitus, Strain WS" /LENGTH=1261 /DNA_ID=CAMNT_0005237043 /DNA_START=301 /DNA_END=4086 /DNA_ORIENTATION=+